MKLTNIKKYRIRYEVNGEAASIDLFAENENLAALYIKEKLNKHIDGCDINILSSKVIDEFNTVLEELTDTEIAELIDVAIKNNPDPSGITQGTIQQQAFNKGMVVGAKWYRDVVAELF